MPKIAIAGWGYNGGQVIFKFQPEDSKINPTIYKEAAETCDCCCLPPPRVKISLHPGTCETEISPGGSYNGAQRETYYKQVGARLESTLSLTLDNIPCPKRNRWEYFYSFTPDGSQQSCSIFLFVPRCARYPIDFELLCGTGDEDDVRHKKFPNVAPPPMHLAITGLAFGPTPLLEYFNFQGFDDHDGSSGFPSVGLCQENVCKPVNQRSFKIPCFIYQEVGSAGVLRNGITIPGYSYLDWTFWAPSDGYAGGKLAYFDVEFAGDQPLP
jgi:hypothetical protein